jgi:hypothetical protein
MSQASSRILVFEGRRKSPGLSATERRDRLRRQSSVGIAKSAHFQRLSRYIWLRRIGLDERKCPARTLQSSIGPLSVPVPAGRPPWLCLTKAALVEVIIMSGNVLLGVQH